MKKPQHRHASRRRNVPRRLARLGISKFETKVAARSRQRDMLGCMKGAFDREEHATLIKCDPTSCRPYGCLEVCQLGARQRRLEAIPKLYRLISGSTGAVYELRVVRESWSQPRRMLGNFNLKATRGIGVSMPSI